MFASKIFSHKKMAPIFYGAIFLTFYYLIYTKYIPNIYGSVGHDYRHNLPNLLSGYYWFLNNGLWSLPWLSPSQCGGSPFFPDINVMYFSVPQFLSFYISPIKAIRVTFFLFAFIGFIGFYQLMRTCFDFTGMQAALGGLLFMFNGFYTYRMLVGHLTVHSFMLLPIIGLMLLPSNRFFTKSNFLDLSFRLTVAGLCFSYMFYSGFIYGIPPVILSVLALAIICSRDIKDIWASLLNLIVSLALASFLSMAKLVGAFAVLSNFPRSLYPLPGYDNIVRIIYIIANNIFFGVPNPDVLKFFNSENIQGRHEFENGLTVVPLILITCFLAIKIFKKQLSVSPKIIFLVFIFLIPVIFNWYQPDWNQFLKTIPLIKSSSTLIRWFCFYTPFIIIAALYGLKELDNLRIFANHQLAIATTLAAAVIYLNYTYDKFYYFEQAYRIDSIEAAWQIAHKNKTAPPISFIDGNLNNGNDSVAIGGSQLNCYQPIFGYSLEKFPRLDLKPGYIYKANNGELNFKNPACYIFPDENKCTAGAHYKEAEKKTLENLAQYKYVDFKKSKIQNLGSLASLITFIFAIFIIITKIISLFKSKIHNYTN